MIKRFKKTIVIFFLISSLFTVKNVFAEELSFSSYLKNIQAGQVDDKGKCENPCGSFTDNTKYQLSFGLPIAGLNKCSCVDVKAVPGIFIMALLQFLLASIGTVATILVIIAGFMWSFSAGNPEVIKKARKMLTDAGIGMIVVIFSGSVLAIINPALLKIMTPNISTINYMCVDDIVAKKDSDSNNNTYKSPSGKIYKKDCDGTCMNDNYCCEGVVCGSNCCPKNNGCDKKDATKCNGITTVNAGVAGDIVSYTMTDGLTNVTCKCKLIGDSVPPTCENSECSSGNCIAKVITLGLDNAIYYSDYYCYNKLGNGSYCYKGFNCSSGSCNIGGAETKKSGNAYIPAGICQQK